MHRKMCAGEAYGFLCDVREQLEYGDIFYHSGVDMELINLTTKSDAVPFKYSQSQEAQ